MEIKEAFFSLPSNKAPGSDGFNALFFKWSWHIIWDDIVRAFWWGHGQGEKICQPKRKGGLGLKKFSLMKDRKSVV